MRLSILLQGEITMPDIYDPERGLKIGLTDEDYENYQNGNLSDDFYARRTDGSIANRVTISPLDDDNSELRIFCFFKGFFLFAKVRYFPPCMGDFAFLSHTRTFVSV